MEKEEEVNISVSEKLTALQIAQAMGGFDVMTMANNERYLSVLFDRAGRILKWASCDIEQPNNPYFVRKNIAKSCSGTCIINGKK